jgi:hypothetical protein
LLSGDLSLIDMVTVLQVRLRKGGALVGVENQMTISLKDAVRLDLPRVMKGVEDECENTPAPGRPNQNCRLRGFDSAGRIGRMRHPQNSIIEIPPARTMMQHGSRACAPHHGSVKSDQATIMLQSRGVGVHPHDPKHLSKNNSPALIIVPSLRLDAAWVCHDAR